MSRRLIFIASVALILLLPSPLALAKHPPTLEIERVTFYSTDSLCRDHLRELFGNAKRDTEFSDEAKLNAERLRKHIFQPEILVEAWRGLQKGNSLWNEGKSSEAQRKWFQTACAYWNTSIAFEALSNLATSLVEQGRGKDAILPLMILVMLPEPEREFALSLSCANNRHHACLALSDICLDCGEFESACFFLRRSIDTFPPREWCGLAYLSRVEELELRIELLESSRWTHSRVKWIK